MLAKIIKHEIKLSIREVGTISILAVLAGLICPLLMKSNSGLLTFFGVTLYIIILGGTALMSIIILYRIFYKSMFDNEGYLTNVIPTKASSLVLGKYISAIILMAITYIAIIVSIGLLVVILININDLLNFLSLFNAIFGELISYDAAISIFINISVYFLVALLSSAATFFFAAALFNTFKVRRYKFVIIFILYVAITQVIGTIAQIPMSVVMNITSFNNPILQINVMFIISSFVYIIFTTGIILLTIYIVDKKVNIQ